MYEESRKNMEEDPKLYRRVSSILWNHKKVPKPWESFDYILPKKGEKRASAISALSSLPLNPNFLTYASPVHHLKISNSIT